MKRNRNLSNIAMNGRRMAGVTLLEVVLGIAVFAFGMLALVQLQGNLTKSSADANTRTVAGNIAEELAEDIRGYQQVQAIAGTPIDGTGQWEYLELTGTALDHTVQRGNLDYAVTAAISDFWWDAASERFIETDAVDPPVAPNGLPQVYADFKLLRINVAWDANQEFYVDDENTGQLGTGSMTIYEIIPSSPPILGAKIAADLNAPLGGPVVAYTPGLNPDIVALKLNDERLKESTTPVPKVIRAGELSETYFEVVSYNSATTFLRREEFVSVGCACTLNPNGDAPEFGRRPTVWNGVEYTEGDRVTDKDVAVSASNQQSAFCEVCCRDHHDGGSTESDIEFSDDLRLVYDPWNYNPAEKGINHEHYGRTNKGELYVAGDNDDYLEACRLVRRDGFFRVAQDFNQQAFYAVADNYLDNLAEVGEYSDYVTTAVADFYEQGQVNLAQPGDDGVRRFTNPADGLKYTHLPASREDVALAGPATSLPTALGFENQQLRSRGIYLDYMTNEVEAKIAKCVASGGGAGCPIPGYSTPLEIYPFFELQLTNLSNWTEEPLNLPVDVMNDTTDLETRGRADLKVKGMGPTKADFAIHKGNAGIALTDPVRDNDPKAALNGIDFLYIDTLDSGLPQIAGFEIKGDIVSGVGGVRSVDVLVSSTEAECGKTPTGYRCIVPALAASPTLTVSNYIKANQELYACSPAAEGGLGDGSQAGTSATFDLPSKNLPAAKIVIQNSPCI
jgi:hypothetical protein